MATKKQPVKKAAKKAAPAKKVANKKSESLKLTDEVIDGLIGKGLEKIFNDYMVDVTDAQRKAHIKVIDKFISDVIDERNLIVKSSFHKGEIKPLKIK